MHCTTATCSTHNRKATVIWTWTTDTRSAGGEREPSYYSRDWLALRKVQATFILRNVNSGLCGIMAQCWSLRKRCVTLYVVPQRWQSLCSMITVYPLRVMRCGIFLADYTHGQEGRSHCSHFTEPAHSRPTGQEGAHWAAATGAVKGKCRAPDRISPWKDHTAAEITKLSQWTENHDWECSGDSPLKGAQTMGC